MSEEPEKKRRRSNRLSQQVKKQPNSIDKEEVEEMKLPSIPPSLSSSSSSSSSSSNIIIPTLPLLHSSTPNLRIPQLGFGTYRLRKNDVIKPVKEALDSGYRLFDTAQVYNNEKEIGNTISKSPFTNDLFVTTKLWRSNQGTSAIVKKNLEQSLKKLQRQNIDLWLMHWPGPGQHMFKKTQVPKDWTPAMRLETWKTMVECQQEGKVKAVGVSNFSKRHLEELKEKTKTLPAVNQVELHPFLIQAELIEYCKNEGIVLMAYCSLGADKKAQFLQHKEILRIAKKHNKTPAQILLKWAIQKGFVIIPCSTSKPHIVENKMLWDFTMDDKDMQDLDKLNQNKRTAWKGVDPDSVQ